VEKVNFIGVKHVKKNILIHGKHYQKSPEKMADSKCKPTLGNVGLVGHRTGQFPPIRKAGKVAE